MSVKDGTYQSNKAGERFCGQHNGFAAIEGGAYRVSANGLRRRWMCAACVENAKKRKAERAAA